MLTSGSPLKVGIEVGSENGRNSDTQQKPGQPPIGTPATGGRSYAPPPPTPHLAYHTAVREKRKGPRGAQELAGSPSTHTLWVKVEGRKSEQSLG